MKVIASKWVMIAMDLTGATSERAWSLDLACGHTVFRRVAWHGRTDPDTKAAPRRVTCELCAGEPVKYRTCEEAEREHYQTLKRIYGKKRRASAT